MFYFFKAKIIHIGLQICGRVPVILCLLEQAMFQYRVRVCNVGDFRFMLIGNGLGQVEDWNIEG